LLLRDAQVSDSRANWADFGQFEFSNQFLSLGENSTTIQKAKSRWLPPEKDIFGYREVWHEAKFLMDESDAEPISVGYVAENNTLTIHLDGSCVRMVDATKDFDQSRFARAIFAEEGMDFARPEVEIDSL
jgi:hypothetical protein